MNFKISTLLFISLALLAGCKKDFLGRQIDTVLSEDEVFSSYAYTERFLTGTYNYLPPGFERIGGAMLESATDNAEHTAENSAIQRFNNGSWGPFSNPEMTEFPANNSADPWTFFYTGIRRANLFMENVEAVNLDVYKLNPTQQTEYNNRVLDLKRWKEEARFLRAYFYFELVKRYGGVPLLTKTLSLDDDLAAIPRNTVEECIRFIQKECDSAAAGLNIFPGRVANDVNATGKVTKGSAMALKSRVLLYAASPLFLQPKDINEGNRPTDLAKWKEAADAAKSVIDLSGSGYALVATYAGFYNSVKNTELILARRYAAGNSFERANTPVGYDQGQSGTTPSQNLVDSYEMSNGKPITDATSGYNPQNPYINRDPRLSATVIVNNSTWKGRAVEAYAGGRDGKGVERATKTGYYLKKQVAEAVNLVTNTTAVHAWPLFRFAEIYLNYAEALNEYSAGHADIARYVNLVRKRAGVADLPAGLSQDAMRQRIRNERRVELAFEDHRFWDVRRWKSGTAFFAAPLRGMDIVRTGTTYSYTPFTVESRIFDTRMYWYPIPQNELIKSKDWEQNPGW